ncbi:type II secretion system F family protein [Leuconostoc falkenbergense]|uniref:type II secretion system F family protein n=1 Tax=Leuconostoc falkenbergense TaxID=2766470 RepID=UPI003F9EA688
MKHVWQAKLHQQREQHFSRFKTSDQVQFFQELGYLLASGYSIGESIDIMTDAHQKWHRQLSLIRDGLHEGQSFPSIMSMYVNQSILVQLNLAHEHGDLANTLVKMGQNLAQIAQQQNKVKQVMHYPIILLAILGIMLLGLKFFLYPILNQWQKSSQVTGVYDVRAIVILMMALLLIIIIWQFWRRMNWISRLNVMSKIPIISLMTKTVVSYQASQQIASMLSGGLTLPDVIDAIACQNNHSASVCLAQDAQKFLKTGGQIDRYILSKQFLNQSLAGYFIRGYTPKTLARYLDHYAKTQFKLLMQQADRLIGTLQPIFLALSA